MRRPAALCLVALIGVFFLSAGCTKRDEPVPDQAAAPASSQPAIESPRAHAGDAQMNRVLSIHKEFAVAFSETSSAGDTVDAVRERLDLVDRTRLSATMLRSDMSDPDAGTFLVRFTDMLQQYLDLGTTHVATLEEVKRLHDQGTVLQGRIADLPDKDKAQATREFNAIVEQHNSLAQGQLARERRELEEISRDLVNLK